MIAASLHIEDVRLSQMPSSDPPCSIMLSVKAQIQFDKLRPSDDQNFWLCGDPGGRFGEFPHPTELSVMSTSLMQLRNQ